MAMNTVPVELCTPFTVIVRCAGEAAEALMDIRETANTKVRRTVMVFSPHRIISVISSRQKTSRPVRRQIPDIDNLGGRQIRGRRLTNSRYADLVERRFMSALRLS